MPSISAILKNKDASDAEKLEEIGNIVTSAREAYGNADQDISSPEMNTTFGMMDVAELEEDSKLVIIGAEVQALKSRALEFAKCNEGVNVQKKMEELVATNPVLANITGGTKFDYL
jgi:hypothetical protein